MNRSDDDNDYLWSGCGTDTEIERLERLLGPFAHAPGSMPGLQAPRPARPPLVRRGRHIVPFAVAASLLVAMLWGGLQWRLAWPTGASWQLQAVAGDVRLDDRRLRPNDRLPVGGELRTGSDGEIRLDVARIGEARLGPDSRLLLTATRTGTHRLELLQGRLWARVWAPPQQFGIRTAGFELLDLGCEFVVDSDVHGNGSLRVRSGWVLVESAGEEVLVPRGARTDLVAGEVPGTPYDEGASPAFVDALHAIDTLGTAIAADGDEVTRLLAAARHEDAISLLSLIGRRPVLAEGPLFDHLLRTFPDAGPVSRETAATDPARALEPWWRALPYPRVKRWWLHWPDMLPARDAVSISAPHRAPSPRPAHG